MAVPSLGLGLAGQLVPLQRPRMSRPSDLGAGMNRLAFGRLIIALGCAYEIVALFSKLPTITAIIKRLGTIPGGRFIVWSWCGYIAWHFMEPDQ